MAYRQESYIELLYQTVHIDYTVLQLIILQSLFKILHLSKSQLKTHLLLDSFPPCCPMFEQAYTGMWSAF